MRFDKILSCCALLSLTMACNKPKVVVTHYANGQIKEQYAEISADTSQLRHGSYSLFDSTGLILEESQYENGKLSGLRKLFINGVLQSEEMRMEDHYHGPYKAFHPNGKLQLEANYAMDIMTGPVKVYYAGGGIKEIVTFADNAENGPFIEYHENGKLKAEGNYIQNEGPVEHGELKLYDTTGVLIKIMNCDKGKCFTTWQIDSTNSN